MSERTLWSPNPYALAGLLSDRTLGKADAKTADDFLRRALSQGKQTSPSKAFDLFEQLASLLTRAKSLADVMKEPLVKRAVDWYGPDAIRRVLPDLLPIADAVFESLEAKAAPNQAVAPPSANAKYVDAEQLVVGGVSYRDPIQGNVADCYLISAMIALAWSRRDVLIAQLDSAGYYPPRKPTFQWQFHAQRRAATAPIIVSARIPIKRGSPRYARSSSSAEYWPGLIEKAYVVEACRIKAGRHEPTPADYQLIGRHASPQAACKALAGGRARSKNWMSEYGTTLFSHLSRRCSNISGVTTVPVMAWTGGNVGIRSYDVWDSTGIWPNHAYAVLGKMPSDHVVLRNPYGVSTQRRNGYSEEKKWIPSGREPIALNEGVFAISPELFNKYFRHIGWVEYEEAVTEGRALP